MAQLEDFLEKANKAAEKLIKDIGEHRKEILKDLPVPINETQARIQQLSIDNGWMIQKLANYEVLILDYGKRLNEMELFIKAPGNSHLRKGIKK